MKMQAENVGIKIWTDWNDNVRGREGKADEGGNVVKWNYHQIIEQS